VDGFTNTADFGISERERALLGLIKASALFEKYKTAPEKSRTNANKQLALAREKYQQITEMYKFTVG
jgi:hypothetical protein